MLKGAGQVAHGPSFRAVVVVVVVVVSPGREGTTALKPRAQRGAILVVHLESVFALPRQSRRHGDGGDARGGPGGGTSRRGRPPRASEQHGRQGRQQCASSQEWRTGQPRQGGWEPIEPREPDGGCRSPARPGSRTDGARRWSRPCGAPGRTQRSPGSWRQRPRRRPVSSDWGGLNPQGRMAATTRRRWMDAELGSPSSGCGLDGTER